MSGCDITLVPVPIGPNQGLRVYCNTCNETVVRYPLTVVKMQVMLQAMKDHMDYAKTARGAVPYLSMVPARRLCPDCPNSEACLLGFSCEQVRE